MDYRCAIILLTAIPQVAFKIDRIRHEAINPLRDRGRGRFRHCGRRSLRLRQHRSIQYPAIGEYGTRPFLGEYQRHRICLGRGSWNVDSSTATGASSGSLGQQKVLVCDLLLSNKSSEKTVISPIDLLSASQAGETLKFGALYDKEGNFRNPESVEVEPGQTVSGIAIWNIDDLQTPVKIKFKCGDELSLTIMPGRLSEADSK